MMKSILILSLLAFAFTAPLDEIKCPDNSNLINSYGDIIIGRRNSSYPLLLPTTGPNKKIDINNLYIFPNYKSTYPSCSVTTVSGIIAYELGSIAPAAPSFIPGCFPQRPELVNAEVKYKLNIINDSPAPKFAAICSVPLNIQGTNYQLNQAASLTDIKKFSLTCYNPYGDKVTTYDLNAPAQPLKKMDLCGLPVQGKTTYNLGVPSAPGDLKKIDLCGIPLGVPSSVYDLNVPQDPSKIPKPKVECYNPYKAQATQYDLNGKYNPNDKSNFFKFPCTSPFDSKKTNYTLNVAKPASLPSNNYNFQCLASNQLSQLYGLSTTYSEFKAANPTAFSAIFPKAKVDGVYDKNASSYDLSTPVGPSDMVAYSYRQFPRSNRLLIDLEDSLFLS